MLLTTKINHIVKDISLLIIAAFLVVFMGFACGGHSGDVSDLHDHHGIHTHHHG